MYEENYDIWLEKLEKTEYKDKIPEETDIVIVGGGITGIISAYLLSKLDKKVTVLEKRKLGENVTDCTTGFLTEIVDIDPEKSIFLYGKEKSRDIFESHRKAIDGIEKIITEEKIECEFERCSNFIYANNKSEEKNLKKRASIYKDLGVKAEFKKEDLKINNFGYIEVKNQAKFHVMKFLYSLAKIASQNNVIITENTKVTDFKKEKDLIEVYLENNKKIKTKQIILATYTPLNKPKFTEGKYNMYRSYVLEYEIPKNIFIPAIHEDTLKPYNYFRIDDKVESARLIIGGNDSLEIMKSDKKEFFKTLDKYAGNLFKNIKIKKVRNWSGLISEPIGGIAYIGESENNVFYAFGFSGNGLTYGYIAGEIFRDNISEKINKYSGLYKIHRKILLWKKLFI